MLFTFFNRRLKLFHFQGLGQSGVEWKRAVAESLTSTAGGPGEVSQCPNRQALSPQGEGHREATEGVREQGGGGGGGGEWGARRSGFPGCQSPSVPSFSGRDAPSHAARFCRVGRRGWAPSARPSIYHMAGEPQKQQLWPRP